MAAENDGAIFDFTLADSINYSFKTKEQITGETGDDGTKNVEIMIPLKYLSNSWRTLEIPLNNCGINLGLNWSQKCVIVAIHVANQGATFSITDTKLYIPVLSLSAQDNTKLLEKLKSDFKEELTGTDIHKKTNRTT